MDDRAIIDALQSGQPGAPGQFVHAFGAVVYRLCHRMMRDRHEAEDLVQETFSRAFRSIHRFDANRPIRPWLLRIAANRCRSALQRRARRPHLFAEAGETLDHRPNLVDSDDLAGEIERAVERLRPDYRLVFTLFHEQELPYDEIARIMDRPPGTVKSWLHRARIELADHLQRRGIGS